MTHDHARAVTDWPLAFADPLRLRIVRVLAGGDLSTGTVAAAVGRDRSLTSHHLKLLRKGGVVRAPWASQFLLNTLFDPHGQGGVLTLTAHKVTFTMRLSSTASEATAKPKQGVS
jgi:DNA-binding transcriptional ArsR family regulator